MPTRGRKPLPIERKRRNGNPGRRPLPEPKAYLEPADGVPEPARRLAGHGLDLWKRTWEAGVHWISPKTDAELVLLTCELAEERADLRQIVMQTRNPFDRAQLRVLEKQLIANLSLLGMTPSDRTRLGVAEVAAQSTLERMRSQRERTERTG